jgi:hypothetical protein
MPTWLGGRSPQPASGEGHRRFRVGLHRKQPNENEEGPCTVAIPSPRGAPHDRLGLAIEWTTWRGWRRADRPAPAP